MTADIMENKYRHQGNNNNNQQSFWKKNARTVPGRYFINNNLIKNLYLNVLPILK